MGHNTLDIAIFAIMGISVFFGFRKGFLKTVTGFVSVLLSLVLATTLHPHVAAYLKNTSLFDKVYESTYSVVQPARDDEPQQDIVAGKLNLPRDFTQHMQKSIRSAADSAASAAAETVANAAVNILSMLLLFLAIRLLLFLATIILGLFLKLPLIGWCDGMLGALFGILRGFLIIYIALAIATFAVTISPDGGVAQSVKQSEIAKVMYHNNVILDFVYKK